MCRKDESLCTDLLLRTVIGLASLIQHLGIGGHRRQHLLITIDGKLILKGGQCVESGIKGCSHLHLIDGIEVGIFLDSLLVDHALRIILVERILEF